MSVKQRVLTGITTTGTPHLGNYLGALKPAVEASQDDKYDSFYFMADYHALIKCHEPEIVHASCRDIAAIWLALGLDTNRATFYRQSDIPEIPQLHWLLTCMASKGLMNRAHAYKAVVDENQVQGNTDLDQGVSMGLFSYPILMSADILMFNAHQIPVGKDQIQHIEMCRDIAARFNHKFGEHFVLPEAMVHESNGKVLSGIDGRKMSKSYGNIIPLFAPTDQLKKLINQIKTNTLQPGEAKDPETCTLFELYAAFSSADDTQKMRTRYAEGIGWGDMKAELFAMLDTQLSPARARYEEIIKDLGFIESELRKGANKAREYTVPFMDQLRAAVGIRPLDGGMNAGIAATIQNNSPSTKKVISAEDIAKAEAGRAKAQEIARQREQESLAKIAEQVKILYDQWQKNGYDDKASSDILNALDADIAQANKKTKKSLQAIRAGFLDKVNS